jgi:hypothetical protein
MTDLVTITVNSLEELIEKGQRFEQEHLKVKT